MDQNKQSPGYKQLTDLQVKQILTLDRMGMSQQRIADEAGCSQATVSRVLKGYEYENFTGRPSKPGPTRKTTERDDRYIIRVAKANHTLPFRDISNLAGVDLSPRSVQRRLKEVDLVSRYARRKPLLTAKHKKDRMEWAKRYENWTQQDWEKVIWSDEALMRIGQDPRRRRVIRAPNTEFDERNLCSTFKSQRVTIMV
jgi:transposase